MTAGARLAALSGLSGVPASVHLAALAAGATAGERLVAWSGLPAGTAMQHLLAERALQRAPLVLPARAPRRRVRPEDEDEAELLLLGLL